jgi:uncharacterized membrane protein YdbT with pleckstrin-like domain
MPGEQPVRVARQHWTIFIPVVLACVVGLVAGSVLLLVTPSTVSGHDITGIKDLVELGLVLVVGATVLIRWVQWRSLSYMLTNHRIVVRHGILSRYTESITLDRIQDSGVRQRILARLLHFGDVEIESAGRDGSEVLRHIADPVGFSNALLIAAEARRTGQPPPGMAPVAVPDASHGSYTPPSVQAAPPPGSGHPGAYSPAPGYSRRDDGL